MNQDELDAWNEFRKHESLGERLSLHSKLLCVDCGCIAEGNVDCEDGPLCDACHERGKSY
jgi:membrane protease subunit (stomatin/prohibitin family)